MPTQLLSLFALLAVTTICSLPTSLSAAEEPTKIELADGKLVLVAPKEWKKEQPKSRIVEHEFSAPKDAKEGDETARVTIMGAGGSVEANIERWYGQFEQADGKSTKEVAKTEKLEAGGQTVHWVDVSGTFKDTMGAGPFSGGKTVLRKDYRMLAGIIVTKDQGQYFIKMTGPKDVVEPLAAGFKKMLQGLETK